MQNKNIINRENQNLDLYDYVPVGICVIDRNYTVQFWNKTLRGWTGISRKDIIGKNLLEIYPHLNNPVYKLRIDLMFNGHPPTIFSSLLHKYFFPIEIAENKFQMQSATLTAMPTGEPKEYYALIAIENETKLLERVRNYRNMKNQAQFEIEKRNQVELELQAYAKKLEESNHTKDKFFSIIAHDLKNPFAGFLGLTQILANDLNTFSLEELQTFGKNLNKSAKNLYILLENLLEWSRMQNDTIQFNPDMCVFAYLVKQNLDIANENIQKKQLTIINNIPNAMMLNIDVSMINSVLRNIIANAIKFTPRNGTIEIGIEESYPGNEQPEYLTIYVKDSGIGIPQEMVDKLFKIEERVSRLGTEGESSTGLGLLLCKEFIHKHDGRIWVESEEGVGTKFCFTLPIYQLT